MPPRPHEPPAAPPVVPGRRRAWLVVEGPHDHTVRTGHRHRLSDGPPPVPHPDADRPVGGDGCTQDRSLQHGGAEELSGPFHPQVVARAAADERHRGADLLVGATHDLLLVPGQTVGEQKDHSMGSGLDALQAAGCSCARLTETTFVDEAQADRGRESFTTERDHDHAVLARAGGRDLTCGGAADQRHPISGRVDPGRQTLRVVGGRRIHHEQPGRGPGGPQPVERVADRRGTRGCRVRRARRADRCGTTPLAGHCHVCLPE